MPRYFRASATTWSPVGTGELLCPAEGLADGVAVDGAGAGVAALSANRASADAKSPAPWAAPAVAPPAVTPEAVAPLVLRPAVPLPAVPRLDIGAADGVDRKRPWISAMRACTAAGPKVSTLTRSSPASSARKPTPQRCAGRRPAGPAGRPHARAHEAAPGRPGAS